LESRAPGSHSPGGAAGGGSCAGGEGCLLLNYEDGEIIYQRELLGEIVRHIRRVRPRAVFTHEPAHIVRNRYLNHPDHRVVGTLALDAVYLSAHNRPSFPQHAQEGLEPHQVKELYLWTSNEPNLSVDITDVVQLKFKALARHRSQFAHVEERMMPRFWLTIPILPWVASRVLVLPHSLARLLADEGLAPALEDGRFRELAASSCIVAYKSDATRPLEPASEVASAKAANGLA
jgi:hypothetical protein